jgi:hypothetical protein
LGKLKPRHCGNLFPLAAAKLSAPAKLAAAAARLLFLIKSLLFMILIYFIYQAAETSYLRQQ